MSTSIRNLIKKEHENIMHELDLSLKYFKKKPEYSQGHFEKFVWMLKKHIFMEEKVIFSSPLLSEKGVDSFEHLLKDHQEILEEIGEIEESFKEGALENLKEDLKAHEKAEEFGFYSKLDDSLEEEERKNLIERIKNQLKK